MNHRVRSGMAALVAALATATCNDVSVTAVDVARIEISPTDPAVKVAEAVTLTARVLSQDGHALSGRAVTWRVTDEQIARIDGTGTVSGVSAGSTRVHAISSGVADSVLLTVEPLDPAIGLHPTALAFSGTRGAANPDAQVVEITNAGGRTLDGLTVSVVYPGGQAGGWVTTSLSGAVAPATLTVGVSTSSLAHGTYTATINVLSGVADNSPQSLAVTLELADALPTIGVSATTAAFAANVGGADPDDVAIDVSNTGGRTLGGLAATITYPSGQQTGWLSADLTGTTAPTTLTLSATTGALPVGTHSATVRVASSVASNSPVTVAATFVVSDVPPGAPGDLVATVVSPSRVDLAWEGATGSVDEYRIDQRTGTGPWREIERVSAATREYESTGLAAATEYTWRVTACNSVGCSPPSNEATATTHPLPPGAPGALGATAVSSSQITLSWSAPGGPIAEYRIERSGGASSGFALVTTVAGTATGHADTGLTPATTYTYRVQACNAGGCSAYSNQASAITFPLPPGAPGGIAAAVMSSSRIDLSWNASSGTVDGYVVERRTGTSSPFAVLDTVAGNTAYQDDGLAPATSYTYRVRAYNSGGYSGYSGLASATTLPDPPATPASVSATTVSSTAIDVTWSSVNGTVSEYRLERRTGAGAFALHATLSSTTTSYDDDGLTPATSYGYRVQACNAGGCSAFTGEATATTHPLPPGVPGTLTLSTISATRIDLAWGASSGTVTGYEVERRTGSGAYALIATVAGATTFANTGLSPATTYVYRVRACNPGGCSAYGNEAAQATLPNPPTAPVLTAQTFDSSSIDLSWSGATGTITEYRLERVSPDAAVVAVLSGLITSHRDIGLTAETLHTYRVQACNAGGCSAYSNEASALTLP